jgi:hypothetical protein
LQQVVKDKLDLLQDLVLDCTFAKAAAAEAEAAEEALRSGDNDDSSAVHSSPPNSVRKADRGQGGRHQVYYFGWCVSSPSYGYDDEDVNNADSAASDEASEDPSQGCVGYSYGVSVDQQLQAFRRVAQHGTAGDCESEDSNAEAYYTNDYPEEED